MKLSGVHANIFEVRGTKLRPAFNACAQVTQVTLVGEGVNGKTIDPIFEATLDAPAAKIVVRDIAGERVVHVELVSPPAHVRGRPAFGGTFVFGSDSRVGEALGFNGAAKLHDRYES